MFTAPNQMIQIIKKDLALLLSISFGVFLFVLFFQPFSVERFDFSNSLIFVTGLAGIVFLFMFLVRNVVPWVIQKYARNTPESVFPPYLGNFIILTLSSVAFAFYLRYVGFVSISFPVMLKIVLICMTPPVILWLYDTYQDLMLQNETLIKEINIIKKQIVQYQDDYQYKSIEFISETSSENLKLPISDVAFIRSANNYVEIVYKEGEDFKKKLIRNTLKNIERITSPYSTFIRCHRICIVNIYFIEKLSTKNNNHWIIIKGYQEKIPVSRQYLLKLKDVT